MASTISDELNKIIDTLAPQKLVQTTKLYQPYLNNEIQEKIAISNQLLTSAITSRSKDNWRQYRTYKANLNKIIEESKTSYLNKKN